MKNIKLYSDGSSLGNPGPGGWGTILEYNGHQKELSGASKLTTNNQMELLGVIKGLEALKEPCKVEIISDSKYVTQAIDQWLINQQKNNWKTAGKKAVKNQDLWQRYLEVSKPHKIKTKWVKGHNGHHYNERCDILAKNEALKLKDS